MSDNRARPRIHRTDDKRDKALREHANEHGIEPWQSLEIAIDRLRDPSADAVDKAIAERDAAVIVCERRQEEIERLRAAVTRAENAALARENQRDDAIADLAAEHKTSADLRDELASAREATRRADAEVERLTRALAAATEAARLASVDRARAEQEAADVRVSYQTRETEWREGRVKLDPSEAPPREPCACALPAELEQRAAALATARGETPDDLKTYCVALGVARLESLARHAPVQAERDRKKREALRAAKGAT